jgi:hypothetical protein
LKNVKILIVLIFLLASGALAQHRDGEFWGGLPSGPFASGFRLIEASDASRSFPSEDGAGFVARPIRVYVWYPAARTSSAPMRFDDYVRMALEDFRTSVLPVPLTKGLRPAAWTSQAASVRSRPERRRRAGNSSLVWARAVLRSPLCLRPLRVPGAHTCWWLYPLVGARYRLVNITVEDVEPSPGLSSSCRGRSLPFADPRALGAVGYDLGGMARLLLTMRHPSQAFLGFDSSILDKHYTGLPDPSRIS